MCGAAVAAVQVESALVPSDNDTWASLCKSCFHYNLWQEDKPNQSYHTPVPHRPIKTEIWPIRGKGQAHTHTHACTRIHTHPQTHTGDIYHAIISQGAIYLLRTSNRWAIVAFLTGLVGAHTVYPSPYVYGRQSSNLSWKKKQKKTKTKGTKPVKLTPVTLALCSWRNLNWISLTERCWHWEIAQTWEAMAGQGEMLWTKKKIKKNKKNNCPTYSLMCLPLSRSPISHCLRKIMLPLPTWQRVGSSLWSSNRLF